jgi:hypothetical protein
MDPIISRGSARSSKLARPRDVAASYRVVIGRYPNGSVVGACRSDGQAPQQRPEARPSLTLPPGGTAGPRRLGTIVGPDLSRQARPIGLGAELPLVVTSQESHLVVVHRPAP